MHCDAARTRIHEWFDAPGMPSMPADIRDHIRDCADCRAFIRHWNAIELQMRALREQVPAPAPDWVIQAAARPRFAFTWQWPAWRMATAGVAALLLLILTLQSLGVFRAIHGANSGSAMVTLRRDFAPASTPDTGPLSPSLPMANTR